MLKKKIDKVLDRAFNYDQALKRINRTDEDVRELSKLVENVGSVSPCLVTNKHVSFEWSS